MRRPVAPFDLEGDMNGDLLSPLTGAFGPS